MDVPSAEALGIACWLLEHLDVFGIDDAGVDLDGFDAGAADVDGFDGSAVNGCFGRGLGDLFLHLLDLLLHRLGLPKHVAVHHVVWVVVRDLNLIAGAAFKGMPEWWWVSPPCVN